MAHQGKRPQGGHRLEEPQREPLPGLAEVEKLEATSQMRESPDVSELPQVHAQALQAREIPEKLEIARRPGVESERNLRPPLNQYRHLFELSGQIGRASC